jgi:hypothetical protein
MMPGLVCGSVNSEPKVWKVSRQRLMLGLLASLIISKNRSVNWWSSTSVNKRGGRRRMLEGQRVRRGRRRGLVNLWKCWGCLKTQLNLLRERWMRGGEVSTCDISVPTACIILIHPFARLKAFSISFDPFVWPSIIFRS